MGRTVFLRRRARCRPAVVGLAGLALLTESTHTLGVEFNRRSWPNNPDAGFYKPHAMVWVCPPGVCRSVAGRL